MEDMKDFEEVVSITKDLLKENTEWENRFAGYIESMQKNRPVIESWYESFRSEKPFAYYITTGEAKDGAYTFTFSMRFMGQEIASIKVKGGKNKEPDVTITTNTDTNKNNFNCDIALENSKWKGAEATKFRKYFKNYEGERINEGKSNNEHRIEQALIDELAKKRSDGKLLLNIQPVVFNREGSLRYPMLTPLSASNEDIKYSVTGGGIDILCRYKSGRGANLCVIELKDEYTDKEPPKKALKQALAYATFIRELLRSKSGNEWYKFYVFSNDVPENLIINVVVAMPNNPNGENDVSFAKEEIKLENDTFVLHYMYFDISDKNILTKIDSSLNKME